MDVLSLHTSLIGNIRETPTVVGNITGNDTVAQSFDELFLGLLLKNLNLTGSDSTDTSSMLNELARTSLTREMALGQTLGLGKLLLEQRNNVNVKSE